MSKVFQRISTSIVAGAILLTQVGVASAVGAGDRVRVAENSQTITANAENVTRSDSFTVKDFADYHTAIKGSWAESYIDTLVTNGGIKGYEDNTFRPKNKITTAELVSIIIGASGTQVDTSNWPSGVMDQANNLGIVDGTMMAEGNTEISREKMAYVLVNSARALLSENVDSVSLIDTSRIPDLATADLAYQDEIHTAYSLGLLAGNDDAGTFKPKTSTSREETCVIINRLFKYTPRVDVTQTVTPPVETPPVETPIDPMSKIGKWKVSDFQFGTDAGQQHIDPNAYIGDKTGCVFPREGEMGPEGKPITRDPVTGVLGFGNGQHGGIYLNRVYTNSAGLSTTIDIGTHDDFPDKIRGMNGLYEKRGNYVYWTTEWNWITSNANERANKIQNKYDGLKVDVYGNPTDSTDAGEVWAVYDSDFWGDEGCFVVAEAFRPW